MSNKTSPVHGDFTLLTLSPLMAAAGLSETGERGRDFPGSIHRVTTVTACLNRGNLCHGQITCSRANRQEVRRQRWTPRRAVRIHKQDFDIWHEDRAGWPSEYDKTLPRLPVRSERYVPGARSRSGSRMA